MFSSNMCSTPFIISDKNIFEFIVSTKRSCTFRSPHYYLFVDK
jgi:hypothetical protein